MQNEQEQCGKRSLFDAFPDMTSSGNQTPDAVIACAIAHNGHDHIIKCSIFSVQCNGMHVLVIPLRVCVITLLYNKQSICTYKNITMM